VLRSRTSSAAPDVPQIAPLLNLSPAAATPGALLLLGRAAANYARSSFYLDHLRPAKRPDSVVGSVRSARASARLAWR
jgi:hypothetical protein